MKPFLMRAVACECVLLGLALLAAQAQSAPADLVDLQIEDLMNVDVTSASKKEQKLAKVPAAIFVITKDDIYRSGATNLPDLLRMVPGMDVAQINPSTWAISARGFNGQYSKTLLVLIDGRSVYTPGFSGVFWDAQDVPLDLIERIEIIRGPGAAIWGANAVNGVINIITKSARDTQGGLAVGSGGTLEHVSGIARYGGLIGRQGAYRIFADGFEMGHFLTPDHQSGKDDWYRYHGGFRAEEDFSKKDSLTVEGEAVSGNAGEMDNAIVSLSPPVNAVLNLRGTFSGWDVLTRWKRTTSSRSETSLQAYFDRSYHGDGTYGLGLNTFDLDFQHHVNWGQRQDLVWGLGYRINSTRGATAFRISLNPATLTSQIFSAFIQDEIAVRPNRLYLTLGTKLEHEYYNGFNWQPTARITWTPTDRNMFWAAVSGAQSTPSQASASIRFNYAAFPGPGNLPALISIFGSRNIRNEHLKATDAGFRKQLTKSVWFDSTAFFYWHSDLTTVEPGTPGLEANPAPEHLLLPSSFGNLLHGDTYGAEIFAGVKLASRWTLSPGYTYFAMHLHPDAGSMDMTVVPKSQGDSPKQQAQLRSQVNLPRHWQWTTSAFFVGPLFDPKIPSYSRLDTNLSWQVSEKISLDLVGQNLLQDLHQEYSGADLTVLPSLVRRSAYARLTWWF
jgi:iron complex outermembrane recepter protein